MKLDQTCFNTLLMVLEPEMANMTQQTGFQADYLFLIYYSTLKDPTVSEQHQRKS